MKGELIGAFINEWRQRRVRIYADTADADMVYTEGEPFPGTVKCGQRARD